MSTKSSIIPRTIFYFTFRVNMSKRTFTVTTSNLKKNKISFSTSGRKNWFFRSRIRISGSGKSDTARFFRINPVWKNPEIVKQHGCNTQTLEKNPAGFRRQTETCLIRASRIIPDKTIEYRSLTPEKPGVISGPAPLTIYYNLKKQTIFWKEKAFRHSTQIIFMKKFTLISFFA